MNVYRAFLDPDEPPQFFGTQSEAHKDMKARVPAALRGGVRIDLVNIPTDKAAIIDLLNVGPGKPLALKSWRMTNRGGLVEIDL